MKEGVIQRIALEEMQWPQPPTPITLDNSAAAGLARDTIKANKSRAMDMRLHWIQDRAQQRQFQVTWAPGPRKTQQSRLLHKTACSHSSPSHAFCVSPSNRLTDQPSSPVSCKPELRGCVESRGTASGG